MQRYRVYRNLNNGMISIRNKKSGRVVGHAKQVTLQDCKFIVSEAGRQRVIKEQRKNVHAFVEGTILSVDGFESFKGRDVSLSEWDGWLRSTEIEIKYNPYKFETFVSKDSEHPMHSAGCVTVNAQGHIVALIA